MNVDENVQLGSIAEQVEQIVRELAAAGRLGMSQLLVIGVSTSEVLGHRIGTSGTIETAAQIYAGVEAVRSEVGFIPVYQCCEHLNRALVIDQASAERLGLDIVGAVPVPKAGGSMAAYAYRQLKEPCLVETVQAHAGIDIGDTFIGMHLKRVAVPVRPTIREIGGAHVTMAITRPKLIGGSRAVYELSENITPEQSAGTCE
ncbi:TIGR01440 family protein [Paenibacillus sp. FSL A5-0031]|uniref:TIGR01440 family protein n=1 Tax=Paenibacillus sp. FSL A5-0031 TaxID=1920420 RepID=UPI00096DB390|nr:TIGR01440 family protein [Paenibacillus sp. FSL A5-0031]OME87218.1 TIGR01440 family protein [Paenibacillus sp. FSL A5-0031]